jgi:hypothetical protein
MKGFGIGFWGKKNLGYSSIVIAIWLKMTMFDGAIFGEIINGIVSYFQNYVFGPKPFMKKI